MNNAVIVDDELNARQTLKNLLALYYPKIKILQEADSVASGASLLKTTIPDIVFLDIHMNDGSGFDLLDYFPQAPFKIIFNW